MRAQYKMKKINGGLKHLKFVYLQTNLLFMKKIILILLILFSSKVFSQNGDVIKLFEEAKNDSVRVDILRSVYNFSDVMSVDSIKYYYTLFKTISQKQNDKVVEAANMSQMGYYLFLNGDPVKGLQLTTEALHIAEHTNNAMALGMINFGLQYFARDNNKESA